MSDTDTDNKPIQWPAPLRQWLAPGSARLHALWLGIVGGLLLTGFAATEPADIQQVSPALDLSADARLAQRDRKPILLFFSASYCAWCDQLEHDFLVPMLRSGQYQDRIIMRKLETDSHATLRGFDGQPVAADRAAYRFDAYLTPTVLLLDHHGDELAERLVGLTTPELYGGYLDQAIDDAEQRYQDRN